MSFPSCGNLGVGKTGALRYSPWNTAAVVESAQLAVIDLHRETGRQRYPQWSGDNRKRRTGLHRIANLYPNDRLGPSHAGCVVAL